MDREREDRVQKLLVFFVFLLSCLVTAQGISAKELPVELLDMSISDLMKVEIYSASKKEQKVADAAAAVFVITQEDIKRSGATAIPDLLRMVPGAEVANITSNTWAVSIRGFNDRFSNKLLVLIDGRSVYSPLFSGVFWDVQDTLLEDIERIEVIRGPGAALWGANAVNGVINIITKSPRDTQGGLVTAGGGTEERGFGSVRYGAKINNEAYYRVYAKYFDRDDGHDSHNGFRGVNWDEGSQRSAPSAFDAWQSFRTGFSTDWQPLPDNSLAVMGDFYHGYSDQKISLTSLMPPYIRAVKDEQENYGTYLLARWSHVYSSSSDLQLQFYYNLAGVRSIVSDYAVHTLDADLQHRFLLGERQEVTWGSSVRLHLYQIDEGALEISSQSYLDDKLFTAFVQDDITLATDRWHLILGSKFEHNDYTGFEIQPNARLIWMPEESKSVWAAVSRAVRTPSLIEEASKFVSAVAPYTSVDPTPFPAMLYYDQRKTIPSEEVLALELGYRFKARPGLWLDLAGFYNIYENLRTSENDTPQFELLPIPHYSVRFQSDGKMHGNTYGIELGAEWDATKWLRFKAAYTLLMMDLQTESDSTDTISLPFNVDQNPKHQFSLRSMMDLPHDVTLDLWLRFVDRLPGIVSIDGYFTGDARLAWKPAGNLEFALVGRNLFSDHHSEFCTDRTVFGIPTDVERSVYVKVTWSF